MIRVNTGPRNSGWFVMCTIRGDLIILFYFLYFVQLFEVELENAEVLLRYSSALVQGATNVFWYDILV